MSFPGAGTFVFDKDVQEIFEDLGGWNPTEEESQLTAKIIKNYTLARIIMYRPYEEFNHRNLLQYMNDCQRAFNNYVPPRSNDPDEAWKANTVRPLTRNKVISIAAHTTSALVYPKIHPQNRGSKNDKDAALVMQDLVHWSGEQSHYDKALLYTVISALVNPAAILYTGYEERTRLIRDLDTPDKPVEVVDDYLSGFVDTVVPIDELYIGDIYESDIQKQPYLIWRRVIDWSTAWAKYGRAENFKYVQPGLKVMYTQREATFYEQYDESLRMRLVEELIYYDRQNDLMVIYVNRVMMTPHNNPLPWKHKNYPFVKLGYELIDEGRFFYYKSVVDKMRDDQRVIDTIYNYVIDGSYLQLMPPSVVYGSEDINSGVIIPGAVSTFRNDTKFETIQTNNNLQAGMNLLEKVESSAAESSADPIMGGDETTGDKTAFEVSRQEENARTMLGLFGKMIGFFVEDYANLRMPNILQYLTVGDVSDVLADGNQVRFREIAISEKSEKGKNKSKLIRFEASLPTEPMPSSKSETYYKKLEDKLFEQEEGMDSNNQIILVAPSLLRQLKFKVKIIPEALFRKSSAIQKALNLEAYDRAISNPLVDQEAVTRDFLLENYVPGETDKYIKKEEPAQMGQMPNQQPSKAPNQATKQGTNVPMPPGPLGIGGIAGAQAGMVEGLRPPKQPTASPQTPQ